MSRLDSATLEQAISIVDSWEAKNLARLLTTAEAGSLIQEIARVLQGVQDVQAVKWKDWACLRHAHSIVHAWGVPPKSWHLNAAQAATLAESIAQALAKAWTDARLDTPDNNTSFT